MNARQIADKILDFLASQEHKDKLILDPEVYYSFMLRTDLLDSIEKIIEANHE